MEMNLSKCAHCIHRVRDLGPACYCAADDRRRPVTAISQAGDCPRGYYALPQLPPEARFTAEHIIQVKIFHRLWEELHGWGMRYRCQWLAADEASAWLDSFAARIPCGDCKITWLKLVKQNPPPFACTVGGDLWQWTVDRHNDINLRLSKPLRTPDPAHDRLESESVDPPPAQKSSATEPASKGI
jgi:hypothetical protein